MSFILQPWQLLLLILAGWVNRQQQEIIEYLRTENHVLRESHGKKRIKLNSVFRSLLEDSGVKSVRLPARSPNLNAHLERHMRSLKVECLNRMIFFGENPLQKAVNEFLGHYHQERNHQGLGNRLIAAGEEVGRTIGKVRCHERLGGMLRYYYRNAA
ncbi:MAG: integrase core domain-containing protein [Candidatus Eisenbacteria sp.]|nr:integrase core domain-containing protein [Candidatus Eisenbacteria bacterium]